MTTFDYDQEDYHENDTDLCSPSSAVPLCVHWLLIVSAGTEAQLPVLQGQSVKNDFNQ